MALHQNRRLKKPDLPEFVALVLVGLAVVAATWWWQANVHPKYRHAEGRILSCRIRPTHYNATDVRTKVDVTYEYAVGSGSYRGSWTGYWPQTDSINAVPEGEIDLLMTRDLPVSVLYAPDDPARSLLHYPIRGDTRFIAVIAICGLGAALVYCCAIYPAWRSRW